MFALTAQVSSIPIVDDNDSLLDIYSRRYAPGVHEFLLYREMTLAFPGINFLFCFYVKTFCFDFGSEITALAKDKAYTHINLNEMTIHQVFLLFVFYLALTST